MTEEVVLTGIGAVTSLGATATETWNQLCSGATGVATIAGFDPDAEGCRTRVAAAVGDGSLPAAFDVDDRATGRGATYGLAATAEALEDAGFDPESPSWTSEEGDPTRVGTAIACAFGGVPAFETAMERDRPDPRFVLRYLPNLPAGHVSMAIGATGPNRAPATACAAGTHAIADAVGDIQAGRADVVIAGGAEGAVSPMGVGAFEAMRALSGHDDPTATPRPFDADRDGFVIGEGSGIMVLEAASHARDRNVTPYATVTGTGRSADSHHPTRPPADGNGLRRAIEEALETADCPPDAVDHVNAHATGTPEGDAAEATALTDIFAAVPPVTAPKAAIGHALGAAGAIEAIVAAKSIESDRIPPVHTYDHPDPDCPVPVADATMDQEVDTVVTTSAGFGGTNGALLLEEP